MVGSARPRYLGGPAWTQPKRYQPSSSRAGCFGLKASSVQSDCAQWTPPPAMQSPGEAVPELTQRLGCCQLHLVLHGWPWSPFPCSPDSWIHVEGVSAFPLHEYSGGLPLELRGTASWIGNTKELSMEMPKLLPCADSKDPAESSVI